MVRAALNRRAIDVGRCIHPWQKECLDLFVTCGAKHLDYLARVRRTRPHRAASSKVDQRCAVAFLRIDTDTVGLTIGKSWQGNATMRDDVTTQGSVSFRHVAEVHLRLEPPSDFQERTEQCVIVTLQATHGCSVHGRTEEASTLSGRHSCRACCS